MGFPGKRKAAGKNSGSAAPRVSKKAIPSKAAKKPAASKKRLKGKGGDILAAMPYLRDFFENNPAMKLIVDAHSGRIVAANHTAREFYGYSPDEFSGLNVAHLNVMSKQKTRAGLNSVRTKKKLHFFRQHHTKGGAIKNVEIFTTPITLNGHLYFASIFHDLTRLVETESNLRRSDKKYRTVLENAADAMFMHDNKGAILDVNQQVCASLGYSREELLGMTIFDVEGAFDKAALIDAWSGMTDGETRTFHGTHRRKDGAIFPVEVVVRMFTSRNLRLFIAIARDISARKAMEKELARTRELLQGVMDNTLTHIWIKDAMGRYLMVNRQWEKEIKVPAHKAIGKTDTDIFSLDVAEKLRANDQLVIAARQPLTTEEIVELNGERRSFITVKFPLTDASGAIYAIGGVDTEITGIKKTEDALRESEKSLSRAQEIAHVGSWELDIETGKETWSDELYRIFGFKPGEIGPTTDLFMGLVHPEDKKITLEHFHGAISGRLPRVEEEIRIIRPDGKESVLFSKLEAVAGNDGKPAKLIGIILDITERKRADLRMRLLQNAMEQADETVIITDADGIIEYANPAAERKSGYPLNALLGKKNSIFKSGLHDAAFYKHLWHTIKTGHIWKGNIINRRADGSHIEEEVTISPVLGDGGAITHFIAIRRDINEQKLLREQLIHAEKLSSIGTFVAGVAHELNNPLTAVIGFSNDLRRRADLPEDLRHTLGIIADQSKRAVGVVKNLLSYSRPHKPERRTLDINKLLESTIGIHRYRLQADGIPVEMAFAPNPLPVHVDAGQIQQVVVNILLNAQAAIKSDGVGGVIRVVTRRESEWLEETAVITISNSGPPIPHENIDRIFIPFFTTKGVGEGIGLGLYIAHGIVKDHRGILTVENLPNDGGVAFHITLPISKEGPAAAAPVPQIGQIPPGTKVLVVDDEALVRDWLTGMLLRHKVFAAGAGSVREAIEYLQNGSFDAIVSDYKMPEKDGIALYRWLAEQRPETAKHFMFLTGAVEPRLMEFCEGQKLTALIKPVDEESVVAAIAQLLAKEG